MTAALIATSDIFNRIAEFGGDGRRFGQGHCHRQRLEKNEARANAASRSCLIAP